METGKIGREDDFTMRACVYIMALATSVPRVPTCSNMAHLHTFSICHMILRVLDVLGERASERERDIYIYIYGPNISQLCTGNQTWLAGPPPGYLDHKYLFSSSISQLAMLEQASQV